MNEEYKKRLASLERFVMYVFEEDKTVVPKESGVPKVIRLSLYPF